MHVKPLEAQTVLLLQKGKTEAERDMGRRLRPARSIQ